MDPVQVVAYLAVGALLGLGGQAIRMLIGLKKQNEKAKLSNPPMTIGQWFDGKKLAVSFILGATAGILAAVTQYASDVTITKDLMMGFVAAGYGGTDFLEGLMSKWLP